MARHYYLTRSGRLRRKDNTLCFEPSAEPELPNGGSKKSIIDELFSLDASPPDVPDTEAMPVDEADGAAEVAGLEQETAADLLIDDLGDLALEPEAGDDEGLIGQEPDVATDAP